MLRVLSCCDRGLLVLGAVLKNKIHFSFLESFFYIFLLPAYCLVTGTLGVRIVESGFKENRLFSLVHYWRMPLVMGFSVVPTHGPYCPCLVSVIPGSLSPIYVFMCKDEIF